MTQVTKVFQYGSREVRLETGEIARQASGAVLASMGDTTVLVTVVVGKEPSRLDFFPLTVDYEERTYSAGRIPGGFFKREGRPSEKAILTCRLIDRPIRPLFPNGFNHEVQVIATVMSVDPEVDPDIVAMIGTSAALEVSGVPFGGPVGAARVGYIDGDYVLNPTATQLSDASRLDLVVAGTESAVLMVESEAKELSEEVMLGAVLYGHEQMQAAISAIRELGQETGVERWEWQPPEVDDSMVTQVGDAARSALTSAYQIADKMERQQAVASAKETALSQLSPEDAEEDRSADVKSAFKDLEKEIVRTRILDGEPRIDGRDRSTVRLMPCYAS